MDESMRSPFLTLCLLVILNLLGLVRTQLALAPGTETVVENLPAPTVVKTLAATGATGAVTYTLVGTSTQFEIVALEVKVKTDATLDFEGGTNPILVPIQAVDSASPTPGTVTGTLTVSLTDVNEKPAFGMSSYGVRMTDGSGENTEVGNFTATDPDAGTNGNIAGYAIASGNTGSVFSNTNGVIKVATGKTLNGTAQPVYILEFVANDAAGTSLSGTTTINIAIDPASTGVISSVPCLITLLGGAVIQIVARYI